MLVVEHSRKQISQSFHLHSSVEKSEFQDAELFIIDYSINQLIITNLRCESLKGEFFLRKEPVGLRLGKSHSTTADMF